ncbi:MAG: hypothetical protein IJN20_08440 [Oscillospiraceae bacterium]|nr:hypothetical protein [Oscillospiraceae bacterium]
MSAPQKFRSAFNGFNREDVVHYLEYLNSKHTAQVNQLTSEADFLRSKLESLSPSQMQSDMIAALQQERDELRAQVEALQARCEELEQSQSTAAPVYSPAEELEVYRRAERTERAARERADLIYRQTNGILGEASVRVNDVATQVGPLAEQILVQLSQLQTTILAGKQSLQDAAVILSTLRSSEN